MKKFRLVVAAAIAGAATLFSAGAAHAGYADPAITITINDSDILGGTTFSYKASSGPIACAWTITYNDGRAAGVPAVQTGNGTSISGTYRTKVVKSVFRSPLKAVCTYNDGRVAAAGTASTQQAGASATVTLRPRGAASGASLPDTGGSNLSLILIGGGLLLVGGGVTYMARRRQSSH